MAMEYRLASRIAARHDLAEGVRARVMDKDGAPVGIRRRPKR